MINLICTLIITLFGFTLPGQDSKQSASKEEAKTINWVTMEEAAQLQEENPKKIFIDMYTNWCGWCKKMDKTSFANETVVDYMNENYYAVKMNAESKKDIHYKGKTYKFINEGRRGYHELAAVLVNGQMSYPTTVFMDEEGLRIQYVPGYLDALTLDKVLHYFGEDHFKSMPYEEFEKTYKSEVADGTK